MKKDAIYEGTREVRTFVDLAHGADVLIMKTEKEREGSYYTTMSALLLTAFTFEAYLNHLGDQTIKFWEEIEPIKVMDKYSVLCKSLMRTGRESLNMLWQHIEWHQVGEQRYLRIWVSGKTGGRWLIAKHRASEALARLAIRQESVSMTLDEAIAAKLPHKVFAFDDGAQPYGFQGTFKRMLASTGLSRDMSSGQERTLYSLRHTYATMELLAGTDIHTLARQMPVSRSRNPIKVNLTISYRTFCQTHSDLLLMMTTTR